MDLVLKKLQTSERHIEIYSKVKYKNILYKNNFYVATLTEDYNIYVIMHIIIFEESVFLLVKRVKNLVYLEHYTAYEIDPNATSEVDILNADRLIGPPTTIIKTARGKHMIRLKEIN